MSKPRDWPNNAKTARDRAAEELAASNRILMDLRSRMQKGEFTRHGALIDVLEAIMHNQTALRHLESVGAVTRPE
ncbi:MAG: hypothetical protein H6658_01940 [Ardenticatenaceae bacterium]|nr:hypothetical protein [Ardenticatenaceae bacterium]